MTTQTQTAAAQTPLDAFDAWCHEYEAALRGEAERDAMFAAEISGDDRPLWWRRADRALVFLFVAGVAAVAVIQIGRSAQWW